MLLEIPWEDSRFLRSKFPDLKPRGGSLYTYPARSLPPLLLPYVTKDYSYSRWMADEEELKAGRKRLPNQVAKKPFIPREHQKEAALNIFKGYKNGWPGFLLADKTGLGKTLGALAGVALIAERAGYSEQKQAKLLIVCPMGVIPVWRQTISSYPRSLKSLRPMIINYQQLHKLLKESKVMREKEAKRKAAAKKAKRKVKPRSTSAKNTELATFGDPTVDWDFIIFDEAHYLKNYPSSNTSLAAASLGRLNLPYRRGHSPYVIYSTATPGSSPLNFAIMANWLSRLLNPKDTTVTPRTWGDFLSREGFSVKKGKAGYSWATLPWWSKGSEDPKARRQYELAVKQAKAQQRKDTLRLGKALKSPGAPFIMRSPTDIAGWPEQQPIPLPLELDSKQEKLYEQAWSAFRNWLKLTPQNKDPKGALVQMLRYRQKASLLKVDAMIENVVSYVEAGNQVFISIEFLESLERYREVLQKKNITVAEYSGRNVKEREAERLRFQRGEAQVVLCTVVEGVSLHAGETLPDGSTASATPRITVLHDVRQNPLNNVQALGRAHRSGQNSITYIPYILGTVEEKVVGVFVNHEGNMNTMLGQEDESFLEAIFRKNAA